MSPKRRNALVTIVTNPQSAEPLSLALVNANRVIYRGAPVSGLFLFATGGTGGYVYDVSEDSGASLPPGLSLDTTTGVISGTPTTAGHYLFTASVQDSSATEVEASFSLDISSALVVVAGTPPDGEVGGDFYSYQFIVRDLTGTTITTGYTYTGDLPNGTALSDSGLLSGTLIDPDGTSYFTVTVTTDDDEISFPASVLTYPELWPDVVSPLPVPDAVLGQQYYFSIPITGGCPPYSIEIATDNLPPGITLSRSGALAGVPTGPATGATSINVRDVFRRSNYITTVFPMAVVDPQEKVQVQKGGVDVGDPGPATIDFVAGDNVTIDAATDGSGKRTLTFSAEGGGGSSADGGIGVSIGPMPTAAGPVLAPQVVYLQVPAGYDFTDWQVSVYPAATVSIDVRASTFPTRPVTGDSITDGHPITTSAAESATGDTSAWGTTAVARGDWLAIALTANDLATFVSVQLQGSKS